MPYIDLNAYFLSDELKNFWKEFSLYIGSLCQREKDIEILDEQYPKIYEETLAMLKASYPKLNMETNSALVSKNSIVNHNVAEL